MLSTFLIFAPLVTLAQTANGQTDIDYNLDAEGPRAPYSDSEIQPGANQLDVYTPATAGSDRPIVLYVHGGGWMMGSKSNTRRKDEMFTAAGFVFISVGYRLSPLPVDKNYLPTRVRSPQHVEDVAEAIRWIHDNAERFGADGQNITLMGHSAGAQIVTLLACDPSYLAAREVPMDVIRGVVALDSAAYNVGLSMENAVFPPMRYQAFGTQEENAATGIWAKVSAITHASKQTAPFLLVTQSTKEQRIAQCNVLAKALGQDPATIVLAVDKTHKGINRDLGARTDDSAMTTRVLAFVRGVSKKAGRPNRSAVPGD